MSVDLLGSTEVLGRVDGSVPVDDDRDAVGRMTDVGAGQERDDGPGFTWWGLMAGHRACAWEEDVLVGG